MVYQVKAEHPCIIHFNLLCDSKKVLFILSAL